MWLDKHLRHRRGYGVHSPFLYRIIREALMHRNVVGKERGLYDELRRRGINKATAARLQNLCTLECEGMWCIDRVADGEDLAIATEGCKESIVRAMVNRLSHGDGMVVVLHSWGNRGRRKVCKELVETHNSMSVSDLSITLYFSHKGLPKQHIVI